MSKKLRELIRELDAIDPEWGDGEGILKSQGDDEGKEALLTVVLGLVKRRARGEDLSVPREPRETAPPWYYDEDDPRYPGRQPDYPPLGGEHPLQFTPPRFPSLGGEHPLSR